MARPCEYVIVFQPLWKALTFYAAWPQKVTKSGQLVRNHCSVRSVATAAMFCLTTWGTWVTLVGHIDFNFEIPSNDVPRRLLNIQFGLYVLSFPVLACFIVETRRNAEYAMRWQEFQPQLQRVCGRSMRNDKLRRSVKATVLALSLGWPLFVTVPITISGDDSHLSLPEVIYLSYATTVLAFASTNWRMHCAFLLHASEMLVDALAEALQRDALTRKDVTRFVTTWLRLRDLAHAGARSVELTCFLNITTLTLTVVLCTFNTMYVVFNGFSKLGAYLSAVGLLTLATYIRIFNAAHRINEALGTRAALTLAGSSFHRFPAETLRELIIFRDILIANPVRISLFGFLPINRNVLGALLVTATTYLVVLVQYSVG